MAAILGGVSFLLTAPLLHGLMYMAKKMEAGDEVTVTDVFHGFSSGEAYRQGIVGTCFGLVMLLALAWLEYRAFLLIDVLAWGNPVLSLLGIPLYIGIFLIWTFGMLHRFLSPYLILWEGEVGASLSQMKPYARSVGFHYWRGFFPWIALSLLTFGILLLADLLPRMMIAYFRLSRKLNELTTRSEELINE